MVKKRDEIDRKEADRKARVRNGFRSDRLPIEASKARISGLTQSLF